MYIQSIKRLLFSIKTSLWTNIWSTVNMNPKTILYTYRIAMGQNLKSLLPGLGFIKRMLSNKPVLTGRKLVYCSLKLPLIVADFIFDDVQPFSLRVYSMKNF